MIEGIRECYPLAALNTFGFSGVAERYAEAEDESALLALLEHAERHDLDPFPLGGGSNLVLVGDIAGLVIRLTGQRIACSSPAPNGAVRVTADAGVSWHGLVEYTLKCELGGLENLALIPGTVGAAPVQNIGAYGVELAERLVSVRARHRPSGRWRMLAAEECAFGYRDSRFKRERGDWIIVSATFELGPQRPIVDDYASLADELNRRSIDAPSPRDVADAVMAIRRAKLPDPDVIGNAGSFFENPLVSTKEAERLLERFPDLVHYPRSDGRVKLAAGWLVDQLGFRGFRENGVGVHERQALVMVHEGGGDGESLMRLANRIRTAVQERFGVWLDVEPLVLGERLEHAPDDFAVERETRHRI